MTKKSSSRNAFFNLRAVFGIMLSSVGVFLALLALSINSSSTAVAASNPNNGVKVIGCIFMILGSITWAILVGELAALFALGAKNR